MNEIYREALRPEKEEKRPVELTTERGSVYQYLPDGRTQRFKTATGELNEPQDTLVFIPPYDLIGTQAVKAYPKIFNGVENETQFTQILLEYAQTSGKTIRVINGKGVELKDAQEVATAGQIFLYFVDKNNPKSNFFLPASKEPKLGYSTYDTRKYTDEQGGTIRERHMGNKVIDIKYS